MLCCEARLRSQSAMVFFNYSTMQMAAKVVYYGPGLCGKTTNLHYIYGHTTVDSRGEMVSLETETDRTLFFDLLPLDVGSIAGFNTRIQLYTVPGQVFYNTTRKLVLKGVDGVVFVVDSQRAMLQANLDSFRNLEENLAEMGLSIESLPLVLQYNKRDLSEIYSVDELNQAINRQSWPHFEASAVAGQGVFETLKGISKYTLLALKRRLGRSGAEGAASPRLAPAAAAGLAAARPGAAPLPASVAPQAAAHPQPHAAAAASGAEAAPAPPAAAVTASAGVSRHSVLTPLPSFPPLPPIAAEASGAGGAVEAPSATAAPPASTPPVGAIGAIGAAGAVGARPAFSASSPAQPFPGTAAPPASPAPETGSGAYPRAAVPAQPSPGASHAAPIAASPAPLPSHPTTAAPEGAAAPRKPGRGGTGKSRSMDVLSELEKLRREALQPTSAHHFSQTGAHPVRPHPAGSAQAALAASRAAPAGAPQPPTVAAKAAGNGRAELSRNIELTLKRADFARARRFLLSFQVEDEQHRVVDAVRDLQVEIKDTGDASIEKLLLHLNIALHAKE